MRVRLQRDTEDSIHFVNIQNGIRIKLDKEADALYFRLDENRVVEFKEVRPGVILDFDKDDRVVGVEFLGVSARAGKDELSII